MVKINVDLDTDISGFGYVEAGEYRLRVVSAEEKVKTHSYIKWTFEFVDLNVKTTDGKGKPGSIFENTTLKIGKNAQFRLRQLIEALGLIWDSSFDTDDAIGREFNAILKVKEYNGTFSNEVVKYLKA